MLAEAEQACAVVAENEGEHGDGACDDHGHTRPGVEKSRNAAERAADEVVFPSRARIGGSELRVTHGADERHDTARDPDEDHRSLAAARARDDRGCLEYAGADEQPDDDRAGVADRQDLRRPATSLLPPATAPFYSSTTRLACAFPR